MRDSTSANTKRAKQAQPQQWLEGTPFFECAGGAGLGLIARDDTLRGGALSAQLVDCSAAEQPVDVLCTCGTALSEDRLSLRYGPSGLVGRVLDSGHTAVEPIVPGWLGSGVREAFTGVDNAPRVANLAGRDDAARVGDVAAGVGRGVTRATG
jgi:hypothetical protein